MKATCFGRWSLFVVMLVVGSGCSTYTIRPEPKSITLPERRTTPLPIKVAVVRVEQMGSNFVTELMSAFKEGGVFEAVYYPVHSNDPFDATMEIAQKDRWSRSPGWFLSDMLDLLTLTLARPFVHHREEYSTKATITLHRAAGTTHTFSTNATAVVEWRGIAYDTWKDSATIRAAGKLLQARLIELMASDPSLAIADPAGRSSGKE